MAKSFFGNPGAKSTKREFTALQKKEIVRCGQDPIYFINTYCKIRHPKRGIIPFNTFPFQDDCINAYQEHRKNIVNKARQLGLSTISAAYALWMALFRKDKTILVIATKLSIAGNFIKKVKVMLEHLPSWLLLTVPNPHAGDVTFSNGSSITAISSSKDAGRSEALSLLVVDEAAWIEGFEDIWTGLSPTIAEGGQVILLSTPNGMSGTGGQFYRIWRDGIAGANDFNCIELLWNVHPEHDEAWFAKETRGMGKKQIAQEFVCDFLLSGDTFLEADELMNLKHDIAEPIEKRGLITKDDRVRLPELAAYANESDVWVWKHPVAGRKYVLSADVARGNARDFSTFHLIDFDAKEVCVEYMGKIPPERYGIALQEWGLKYNKALIICEVNSIGYSTNATLKDVGYPHLFHEKHTGDAFVYEAREDEQPGFNTKGNNRPRMLTKFAELLRTHAFKTKSQRLYDQLQAFMYVNGKPMAPRDGFDDLVMSAAIGSWLMEIGETTNDNLRLQYEAMGRATKVIRRGTDCLPRINEVQPLYNPAMMARSSFRPQDPNVAAKHIGGKRAELSDFSWLLG